MQRVQQRSSTSVRFRVFLYDTSGAAKTGLTNSTSGLIISVGRDDQNGVTAYTQAAGNIETITTLGTWAAPTSGKVRFKEVDATNAPGIYEVQVSDSVFTDANMKELSWMFSGAGLGGCPVIMQVGDFNLNSSSVVVGTNNDKTGYALTSAEHTLVASDVQTGMTSQGYTTTRAPYLDTLNGLVQAIWDKATSALTTAGSIGKRLVDNVDAVISAIKTQTDKLAFTGAKVDAQVRGFDANVIDAAAIANSAIDAATFATGAIDANAIADNAIDAGAIAAGAITNSKFAAGAIDAAVIATDAIDNDAIAASAITEIQNGLATASEVSGVQADVATLLGRLTDPRATLLDNLSRLDAAITTLPASVRTEMDANSVDLDAIQAALVTVLNDLVLLDMPISTLNTNVSAVGSAVTTVGGKVDQALAQLDAPVTSRLADIDYVAPDNAGIAANGSAIAAVASVTVKLDAMIEADGPDWRFDANALELAPTAGTVFTPDQAAEIKEILGVTGTGTPADLPTAGAILNTYNRLAGIPAGDIEVVGPVAVGGDVHLINGYDYTVASGQALVWSSGGWPDLTGAVVNLVDQNKNVIKLGEVVNPGSGTQSVRVELTQANLVTIGKGKRTIRIWADLPGSSNDVALVSATMTIA